MSNQIQADQGLPDLRLPIGIFFFIVAVIVLTASFARTEIALVAPVSAEADRDWGVVLLVFSLGMAYFGWKAGPQLDQAPSDSAAGDPSTPPHSAMQERGEQ